MIKLPTSPPTVMTVRAIPNDIFPAKTRYPAIGMNTSLGIGSAMLSKTIRAKRPR